MRNSILKILVVGAITTGHSHLDNVTDTTRP